MAWRDRRRGENEAFVRALNETIGRDHSDYRGRLLRLVCECSSSGCRKTIRASQKEYEAVRSTPSIFLVAPGHEDDDPGVESVILRTGRFFVVQKAGAAAAAAEQTNPRT
jgi:hypothetical protein